MRGLCHYHSLLSAVPDSRVWVDVYRYPVPAEYLGTMECHHRESDIARYMYTAVNVDPIHSAWLLTFFEKVTFVGLVSSLEAGFGESR